MRPPPSDVLARVLSALEVYELGVNQLGEPAFLLDTAIPESLAELYQTFDGGTMFHDELVLLPSASISLQGERFFVGEAAGDELYVEPSGRVIRLEKDTGDEIVEATAIDRWLHGFVDAAELLYERDGEFRDGVFTEAGDIENGVEMKRQQCFIKRDPQAPGPRWRLARLLATTGKWSEARDHLEKVVVFAPGFAWAWFDLAKISERCGELTGAIDEMEEGARVAAGADHQGFFLAHLARLSASAGDDAARSQAAAKAIAADPDLVENLLAGADAELAAGADASALQALLAAIAPKDLRVIDLGRRLF